MKKYFDYLTLGLAGILFLSALKYHQGQKFASFLTVISYVLFYIVWSIYHHHKNKILLFKNVVEYLLIGFTILVLAGIILNI